ncbi:MAG TPA: pirin-like C-terminal cupin domain-containing protein [Kofleriaceae bacterium]|nr:pirin-like C-terminal cupin domain-containing protein [Kofleriaceae bacterium]
MSTKRVTATAHVTRRRRSAGLSIGQLHAEHLPDHLDPFLAFDHFEMAEPFFPPHPHAGFSAVTYMFPESANGFLNRDTLGARVEIHPGDLHWTAAGRGLMHEETPMRRGVRCHGLQIFVNLHSSKKWMAPQVLHTSAVDIPRVHRDGAEVRVVAGAHGDTVAAISPPTEVTLLDVVLAPGATLEHRPGAGESRFVYVIDGALEAGAAEAAHSLVAGDAAGLSAEGDVVRVRAGATGAHLVLAGGRPLGEPAVFYGPFCMTSQQDLARAVQAYQDGRMGQLEPSF